VGTVVDAGQHDQRADRRHLEGERQQHGDRSDWTDARENADERPDGGPDQAE
jgi:hypothetical protein